MKDNIDLHKKQISRLLKKIDNEKFLRRVYISLRDFYYEDRSAAGQQDEQAKTCKLLPTHTKRKE